MSWVEIEEAGGCAGKMSLIFMTEISYLGAQIMFHYQFVNGAILAWS